MTKNVLWTCPYCNRACTLQDSDIKYLSDEVYLSDDHGRVYGNIQFKICPNPECRQISIASRIWEWAGSKTGKMLHEWFLVPESNAKPFPDYIPLQLREDYQEACLIKYKSSKASATLSRRCLQGIIRDFWGIKKGRLFDEIAELEEKVDAKTWQAIDSVRHVGNIGAHMEKDVNLIIDVDPEEAALLIWLIETLFEEWYIERHERDAKMQKIIQVAQEKKLQKNQKSSAENPEIDCEPDA